MDCSSRRLTRCGCWAMPVLLCIEGSPELGGGGRRVHQSIVINHVVVTVHRHYCRLRSRHNIHPCGGSPMRFSGCHEMHTCCTATGSKLWHGLMLLSLVCCASLQDCTTASVLPVQV